jgi:hypothetical protein
MDLSLDRALAAEPADSRERGIVVTDLQLVTRP